MSPDLDQHLSVGAAALHALPEDEEAEFAEHLMNCPTCPAELTGFEATAALLGTAVAQAPPAQMRAAVLERVRITPQLPPRAQHRVDTGPIPVVAAEDQSPAVSADSSGDAASAGLPGAVADRGLAQLIPLHRPWYRRPQLYLAAAAAAVVIAGGTTIALQTTGSHDGNQATSCVSAASDLRTLSPQAGQGDVVYSADCAQATVIPAGLPSSPAGDVYQLWAMHGTDTESARSLGVLTTMATGSLKPVTADLKSGETTFAITAEPGPDGSKVPSSTPVWVVRF